MNENENHQDVDDCSSSNSNNILISEWRSNKREERRKRIFPVYVREEEIEMVESDSDIEHPELPLHWIDRSFFVQMILKKNILARMA